MRWNPVTADSLRDLNTHRARVQIAADAIRAAGLPAPEVAVIAGSGLSGLADRMADAVRLPFDKIPGWPASTVQGHAGLLAGGLLEGVPCLIAAGRAHLYEGYSAFESSFNVRVFHALGARVVIVTNAAGGLNATYRPGDLMLITDHLFLPGMVGMNPLVGPNEDAIGPRFPGVAGGYDLELGRQVMAIGADLGFRVHRGVYAMVAGPSFESPAEARFLKQIGADAVGMSTCPEVVVARHAGLRVLGLSLITNRVLMEQPVAVGEADLHEEVMATGAAAAERLGELVARVVAMGSG
jgi:purine-nucleoside phosphorylase